MNSTQKQRDFITSLLTKTTVEAAFEAGAITSDMAIIQRGGPREYRSPREVARHCNSKATASKVIEALLAL